LVLTGIVTNYNSASGVLTINVTGADKTAAQAAENNIAAWESLGTQWHIGTASSSQKINYLAFCNWVIIRLMRMFGGSLRIPLKSLTQLLPSEMLLLTPALPLKALYLRCLQSK